MNRLTGVAVLLAISGNAAGVGVHPLTPECEAALALSAAPGYMRGEAGVLVLGKQGYEEIRPSRNGYRCIVERNHETSLIPQCFDAASRDANLAVIVDEGRLLRNGMSFEELAEHRRSALESGKYPSASAAGVVYMISDFNYIYAAGSGRMLKVAPHVMYHAPGLSNDDIGADPEAALRNPGLPLINAEGPHGFMISFTRDASDSTEVLATCRDQLPPDDDLTPFPAAADLP